MNAIVVGTDGSETALAATREAVRLAAALGARLDVVSAYEPGARAAADAALAQAQAIASAAGVTASIDAREGDPADAILDVAEERGAELVVVGHKGLSGADRFTLGSVSSTVAHHAPCSVLLIRTR